MPIQWLMILLKITLSQNCIAIDIQMGLSCPSAFSRLEQSLPVINMIIVGFKHAGKTSIVSKLGNEREKTQSLDSSLGRSQLQIGSCILKKRVKLITFEISSAAAKTWKNYYPNAHVLVLVVDSVKLESCPLGQTTPITNALDQIDEKCSDVCKIIIAFNKIDQANPSSCEAQNKIVEKMATLNHEFTSLKCSALTGEGIDKLVQIVISIHKNINL